MKTLEVGRTLFVTGVTPEGTLSTIPLEWGFIQWFLFIVFMAVGLTVLYLIGGKLKEIVEGYVERRIKQKRADEAVKDLQNNPITN